MQKNTTKEIKLIKYPPKSISKINGIFFLINRVLANFYKIIRNVMNFNFIFILL